MAPFEETKGVVETVVNALASLYSVSKPDFSYRITRYYLERWAPDFRVGIERAVSIHGSCLLTLNRYQPEHFSSELLSKETDLRTAADSPAITPQPELKMKRLLPAYRSGNRIYVHAPNADDRCIEVTIDALGEIEKKTVAKALHFDIWAPAGVSRYQFYRQRVAAAFPDFDCGAATFSIGAASFHNPLLHLSQPLA